MKQENYIRGMIMIILSAFFFACMNVSVRLAGDLPSVQKSFFRNLVAAFFAAIILIKNHTAPKVEKTQWGSLFLRCAFGTLGILCNFYAIDHLLVADASILNKLSPFFAIIFSFLLLKEKIKPAQAMCVILAFVGCLFVVKPGFENAHLIPALIGVCGGLGAGIAYTMVRKMGTHGVKGPVIVFYFSCFSQSLSGFVPSIYTSPSSVNSTIPCLLRMHCPAASSFASLRASSTESTRSG
jgi:drug/metabolite transporter (DMT)-like permease